MPDAMPDPVARMIAEAVQSYVLGMDLSPWPAGVVRVQAYPTGELATGIAVETADRGIRYFLVRVTEFHHPSVLTHG